MDRETPQDGNQLQSRSSLLANLSGVACTDASDNASCRVEAGTRLLPGSLDLLILDTAII